MNDFEPRSPRNTTAADPLLNFMDVAFGGGIEAQEAQGQREILASETLPSEILHCTQDDMEALGFVFGEVVASDPMFREVTLPDGWKREGSDHAMWSYIVDERGIRRVAIFYKAAFYDRSAHMAIDNVGYSTATSWIYGDAEKPELHPELTPDELIRTRERAEHYVEDAERNPTIYGDRLPRARSLIAAIDARFAERSNR